MEPPFHRKIDRHDQSFKIFYELMSRRVQEILLVSSPYDAFIIEEDGRIAGRILHEYSGLNLTRPPRVTWVSTAGGALKELEEKSFDLVITMPRLDDMHPMILCKEIRSRYPALPIYLLSHDLGSEFMDDAPQQCRHIDKRYVWLGNTDLFLALVKNTEDAMNVEKDTQKARVRVILLVEDSPLFCSSILPFLYKEVVRQTQAAMDESLNEEHRILRMRARPKILTAENFEVAEAFIRKYQPFLLSIFCDAGFPRNGKRDPEAGRKLLSWVRNREPELPLLLLSAETSNRSIADKIPAIFLDKLSPSLHQDIRTFLRLNLGFGDFIFRMPNGEVVGNAGSLKAMEKVLPSIPDASIHYHAAQDHFSTWLIARSEIELASALRRTKVADFPNVEKLRNYLISNIRTTRLDRQKGLITDFSVNTFDGEADFVKIGMGSLGGKARGIAFISSLLRNRSDLAQKYPGVRLTIPKTLAISTDTFETFMAENNLKPLYDANPTDEAIEKAFKAARLPQERLRDLEAFLRMARYPLAVRSSSLFEDAQAYPSAGVYQTLMIPNVHPDLDVRVRQLTDAIKAVYASSFFKAARSFPRTAITPMQEDQMAVMVQQIVGQPYDGYYYPPVSGVAQSYNFYPVEYMKPEEGIAHIALGLGRLIVEGGACLRFSPRYPQILPQLADVDTTLRNTQSYFWAVHLDGAPGSDAMKKLSVAEAGHHPVMRLVASMYVTEDHRIRDSFGPQGLPVITFANILKYNAIPLPELIGDLLEMGRQGLGCPVEIEFAVTFQDNFAQTAELAILQIRPMAKRRTDTTVDITESDKQHAFCYSSRAMGNGHRADIHDIIVVDPERFDTAKTSEMAAQIARLNALLAQRQCNYILIGPGRWGSADPWLGIPVAWKDISSVGIIVETGIPDLHVDPSQGTHFFHNITTMGISYLNVSGNEPDFMDWDWLSTLPAEIETQYIKHLKLKTPIVAKTDGRISQGVLIG